MAVAVPLQCHPWRVLFQLQFIQPFLLVMLFTDHVSKAIQINSGDLKGLVAIKNTLTDTSHTNKFFSTWDDVNSTDPCSTFAGVTCDNDPATSSLRVTMLTLGNTDWGSTPLAGSLSNDISGLDELTQITLSPGIVTGPIPFQLGRLTSLRVISLSNNRFTGPIPISLSFLTNLHTLDLSHNQLSGSIPPGLMDLPQLKILILSSNSFTGNLPSVSAPLLHLDLKANELTGPLPSPSPTSLPTSLRYITLAQNRMVGSINGLQSLSKLEFLDLSMNAFTGPISSQFFCLPTLSSLFLQRNNLSGWVPQHCSSNSPSSYVEGSTVDLSHNLLTGQLSTLLAGVESLYLNNNRLIGKVPEEYMKSMEDGRTKTLYLQHNYLTGFAMEERATMTNPASFCISYNCFTMPTTRVMSCPANSGAQISRPVTQCSCFYNGSSQFGNQLE